MTTSPRLVVLVVLTFFPTWVCAQTTAPAGGVEVRIKSAFIDFVALRSKPTTTTPAYDSAAPLMSNDKLLIITLEIQNNSGKEVQYRTVNGSAAGRADYASLCDENRKYLTLARFADLEPVGVTPQAAIAPGQAITDVLVFAPPATAGVKLTLILPGPNFGLSQRFQLPLTAPRAEGSDKSNKTD